MTVDVATIGEAMLRLSVPASTRLEEARHLDVHVAGAELNTAIALASLGRNVAWMSLLPDDALGRRVIRELRANNVNTSHIRLAPDARMGLYFVELAQPPRSVSVIYDRQRSAAAAMGPEDVPWDVIETARIAHVSGITPALSPSTRCLALAFAERARSGRCLLTVDINYRAKLWEPVIARQTLLELATGADLVVLTREDAQDVFGWSGEPRYIVKEARRAFEVDSVVLTLGEEGATWESQSSSGYVKAQPTTIADRLGAGDAFMAGVLDGLLDNDFERGLKIGAVLASLALGTQGDHMVTTRSEVDRILGTDGRQVDR